MRSAAQDALPKIALLCALLPAGAGCGSQSLADRAQAMLDAQNAGQVDLALSFFAPGARIENDGLWAREGAAQIRDYCELQQRIRGRFLLHDLRERRDRVICDIEERNDLLDLLGIEAIFYRNATILFGPRGITRVQMRRGARSRKAQERCRLAFARWAREWRRHDLERLIARSGFEVTSETVAAWRELLEAYRRANPEGCR
ncbi:MAG: hypothetical protein GF330_06245 [Candidatus Eisenbacteria bacterium]|nr:hypothetical protein [Candidatus Eisenbacteria bacterium]